MYIWAVLFVFKLFDFSSVNIFIFSFIYLILASVVGLSNNYILSYKWVGSLSFYVLSLFIMATFTYIYEQKLESRISYRKRKVSYFYLSVFSLFIFLFLAISLNFIYFKVSFFNIFCTEKYFNETEVLNIDGKETYNEMHLEVEKPGYHNVVSGLLTVEGWAIDESKVADNKIDYVGVYLDNKPIDGGEFVTRCNYGFEREDIGKAKGDKFKDSGFCCSIDSTKIENGLRRFYVYFHSNYFGWQYKVLEIFINNENSFIFENILTIVNKGVELNYSDINEDGSTIIIEKGEDALKYIKMPVNIESNQDYFISFDIKKNYILDNILDNYIYFDFFGDGYDNSEQEFKIKHTYIGGGYKEINHVINTGDIPSDTDIYFRIFTRSSGSLKIENLRIYKIIKVK